MDAFALLDDAPAGSAVLLSGLRHVDRITLHTLDDALATGWARGLHCFAWLPYDLGEAHHGIRTDGEGALYWFEFREEVDVDAWLPDAPSWLTDPRHDLTREQFTDRIRAIHEAIADGETYQINFTHHLTATLHGAPAALYRRLRERQPVAFGVLAHLPGPAAPWTLSLSPELFLTVAGDTVTTRPMKGTAPATDDPATLRDDEKNRAENLMIVDLLRNDLGRLATPGTVEVPRLFEVERVGDLWQMTSTVRATLPPGTTPAQLLDATFPCGSITGAPKLASMDLIRQLEHAPRGLYTGSLGEIVPDDGPLGWRTTLSVVIRTLEIDDAGTARMGIGSGVVADSHAAGEWDECLAKARFTTGLEPNLTLKEALLVVDGEAPLLARHRSRLQASTTALGFATPDDALEQAIAQTPPRGAWRLGVEVRPDGTWTATRAPLTPTPEPVPIILDDTPWSPSELARHKTNDRAHLDAATARAAEHGAFDAIGHDVDGRVLEGGRTTVFALVDGRWLTPPLDLGILDGTMRAEILANPALIGADEIHEIPFTLDDLRRASTIIVANAVRGPLRATLTPSGNAPNA